MAVAQQFVRGAAAGGEDRGADADLDAVLARAGQQRLVEGARRCARRSGSTFSPISAQRNAMANSSPLSRATTPRAGHRRRQPLGNRAQHQVAIGVAEHVVDLLKAVEAEHQQRDLAAIGLGAWRSSRPDWREACCGWQARSAYRIRRDIGSFRPRACAPRCRAGSRRYWKPSVPCQPEKLASTGNTSPLLRRPSNSITGAGGELVRRSLIENAERRRCRRAHRSSSNGLADHLLGLIAEDRGRAGIPHRDQVVGVGADQAVAERHRDALEAALGDPAEQGADVDFVERDGGDVDDDGDMEQRGVENERELRLQQRRRPPRSRPPLRASSATRRPAERRRQVSIMISASSSEAGQRDGGRKSNAARGSAASIRPPAPAAPGRTRCRRWER